MKKITQKQLNNIIKQHSIWLKNPGGPDGERADLSNLDLRGLILTDINLSKALLKNTIFSEVKLQNVCLTKANLKGADLGFASLDNCNLNYAILENARLCFCELHNTTLESADLKYANLHRAILKEVDLSDADLEHANLREVDLSDTKLEGTKLERTSLEKTIFPEKQHYRLGKILTKPMKGYRKCNRTEIVTFEIPKGALVFGVENGRLRTNKAKVVAISGGKKEAAVYWWFTDKIIYKLNKTYTIDNFDLAYNLTHTNGIHFFKTKKEAGQDS